MRTKLLFTKESNSNSPYMIPLLKVFMPKTVEKPLMKTLTSGYIGEGPRVKEFEERFGKWLGTKNVLMLNCATSGLHLAYHLCITQPGDEIITTPMTSFPTNAPIVNIKGGKIVWADIDPLTGLISAEDIERKITRRTKAIVMVHWGGNPCDIDRINQIAKKYNVKTIEDAAHSIGTVYKGRHLGHDTSDFVIYSFQAIKHINTVDGGALICRNSKDYRRAKLLRWYGIDRDKKSKSGDLRCEQDVPEAGYKFHMNDVAATIGLEMMKYVDSIVRKHRENAKFYNQKLKVVYAPESTNGKSGYWLYTIHIDNGRRDEFMGYMKQNGVMVSKVHARNDWHSAFKKFKSELPGVDKFYSTECCIPVGWWLTKKDLNKVVTLVNNF